MGSCSVPIPSLSPKQDFLHKLGIVFIKPGVYKISAHCQIEAPGSHGVPKLTPGPKRASSSANPSDSPLRASFAALVEDIPLFLGRVSGVEPAVLDWFHPSPTVTVR